MKQKDIALIGIIVFISIIVSYLVSNKLFATPADRHQQVDIVQQINSSFSQPDKRFFNSSAFDPTQVIQINPNNNGNPFNSVSNSTE